MDETLQERFKKIQREYKKGKRKLEKLQRKNRAKAHVQQKLREQAGLQEDLTHTRQEEASDNVIDSRNSSFEYTSLSFDEISSPVKTFCEPSSKKPMLNCEEKIISSSSKMNISSDDEFRRENGTLTTEKNVSSDEKKDILNTSSIKDTKRNMGFSKYMKRNHVVKLSGGASLLCSTESPTYSSPTDQNSNILADPQHLISKSQSVDVDSSQLEASPDVVKFMKEKEKSCMIGKLSPFQTQTRQSVGPPCVGDSEAIIFERRKPVNKTDKEDVICLLDDKGNEEYESNNSVLADSEEPLNMKNVDFFNSLNTVSNNSSLNEFSQTSDTGMDVILKRSLPRKKRRSLSGTRRLSPRVAGLNETKLNRLNQSDRSSKKVYNPKRQDLIIVTSMFQCLIDDVKRDKKIEDFELTSDYFVNTKHSKYEPEHPVSGTVTCEQKANDDGDFQIGVDILPQSCVSVLENEYMDTKEVEKIKPAKVKSTVLHVDVRKTISKTEENNSQDNNSEEINNRNEPTMKLFNDERPGLDATFDSTPKCEAKHSQSDYCSPTLFDSPNSTHGSTEDSRHHSVISLLSTKESDLEDHGAVDAVPNIMDNKMKKERAEDFSLYLERIAIFEIPSTEVVLSLASLKLTVTNRTEAYIVCLCTQSIRFYCCTNGNQWTNVLNYTLEPEVHMKKNSGGRLNALQVGDGIGVVLQQPKTNLTYLHLYLYRHGTMDHIVLDSVYGKSVIVKCLQEGVFFVSYFTSPSSFITKYTYNMNVCDNDGDHKSSVDTWEQYSLERAYGQITCLVPIENFQLGLIGITSSRKLYIWNHKDGVVLSTIDILDVCSKDVFCPAVFSEEGYLFLPVLNRKKGQGVGSVIVVNPLLSTSETLVPLHQPDYPWKGCFWASCMTDGILCARETTGQICFWDIYDGHLLASLDTLSTSCFTSINSLVAFIANHNLHIFTLRNVPFQDHRF